MIPKNLRKIFSSVKVIWKSVMKAHLKLFAVCIILILSTGLLFAGNQGLNNTSQSPYVSMSSVDIGDVQWDGGFWGERFELAHERMIPFMWMIYMQRAYKNFRIAANLEEGEFWGKWWHDGDFYKWLESMIYAYAYTGDEEVRQKIEEIVDVIGKAQAEDGYISTPIQIGHGVTVGPFTGEYSFSGKQRWESRSEHETYNFGHLFTAACVHHRVTGNTAFLNIAQKAGDYLYTVFKEPTPELALLNFNPSQIMGLVELYRSTGEQKYLELAEIFVNMRGIPEKGTDQNQNRTTFRKETEAVGHAVTANYLYAGVADIYAETGDQTLLEALERIWENVVYQKMYITGATGSIHQGVSSSGDPVHEAYGREYDLPNVTGYNETCANIANGMWNWRMLIITGDVRFADVMEQVFYNSGISGIGIHGIDYFYTNIHRFYGQNHHLLSNDALKRWNLPRGGICCPPNVVRLNTEMSAYAYGISQDAVWVNLYGSNRIKTELPDGTGFSMIQVSDYPWEGDIKFTLEDVPDKPLGIRLRIPGWATAATIAINGNAVEQECQPGTYVELRREWTPGDKIHLKFPMDARLIEGHPRIEQVLNQVAIMRGPVVYCLESVDLPDDIDVDDIVIPGNINFNVQYESGVLDGVAVLKGEALVRKIDVEWKNKLYRIIKQTNLEPVVIQLIPYYAWNNRHSSSGKAGVPQMTVWMPFTY